MQYVCQCVAADLTPKSLFLMEIMKNVWNLKLQICQIEEILQKPGAFVLFRSHAINSFLNKILTVLLPCHHLVCNWSGGVF